MEGDRNYSAPPLRSAPVFGGIAGIMSHEAAETSEDAGHMSSLSSKSRELGELQDMYRRTLAASWAAQPGVCFHVNIAIYVLTKNQELRADECIEDIFAGGDGWGSHKHGSKQPNTTTRRAHTPHKGQSSDDEHKYRHSSTRTTGTASRNGFRSHHQKPSLMHSSHNPGRRGDQFHRQFVGDSHHGVTGRTSINQQVRDMKRSSKHGKRPLWNHEVDEFDNPWRQDLSSWTIRPPVDQNQ